MSSVTIALAGNPNCGKTTLFNSLTGSRQKVANWAGVTVEKKSGTLVVDGAQAEVVDLPGVYSLNSKEGGLDEKIAHRFITEEAPELILNIVDASNLKRHLLLTHELLDLGRPTILVVNMLDVAEQNGVKIDIQSLEQRLGIPVIPIVASKKQGLNELLQFIKKWIDDPKIVSRPKEDLLCKEESLAHRYHWVKEQTQDIVIVSPVESTFTERVDRVVLNRFLGIPIFLLMMYLMFMLAINLGAVFIDFFDILFGAVLVDGFAQLLSWMHAPPWLITILAYGVGGGIQLVGTFIPVIGFLYLCLSFFEDSGYMARAAFVVDRLMAQIGLPGHCFVPLIVGFGCNVPSVMASRSLTREQDRLLTIAMSPFMSCGARLTVYALFAAAFFPDSGTFVVFALYLLGIVMAVLTGLLFRKTLFTGEVSHSFQEMPAYHLPLWGNIFMTTWHRLRGFIVRAGKTIVQVVTILTVINSVGLDGSFGHQDSRDSLLSEIGRQLTPALTPVGVEENNWPATVGVFTGIFAKEAVVGTLDALYQDAGGGGEEEASETILSQVLAAFISIKDNLLGLSDALLDPIGLSAVNDDVSDQGVSNTGFIAMQSLFGSTFAAFCYLVFILLYTPCVAVIGAMHRESGWKWSSLVVAWSSFLAYWTASNLYQIGTFSQHPTYSACWVAGSAALMAGFIYFLRRLGRSNKLASMDIIAVSR